MFSVIKQHNYKVLSATKNLDQLCNCRNKDNCPLDGKCLRICIFYKADGIKSKDSHIYYGANDGEFKSQYNNKPIHFAIDITNKTQNFQSTSRNYTTNA